MRVPPYAQQVQRRVDPDFCALNCDVRDFAPVESAKCFQIFRRGFFDNFSASAAPAESCPNRASPDNRARIVWSKLGGLCPTAY